MDHLGTETFRAPVTEPATGGVLGRRWLTGSRQLLEHRVLTHSTATLSLVTGVSRSPAPLAETQTPLGVVYRNITQILMSVVVFQPQPFSCISPDG